MTDLVEAPALLVYPSKTESLEDKAKIKALLLNLFPRYDPKTKKYNNIAEFIYKYHNQPFVKIGDNYLTYLTKQEKKTGKWKQDPIRTCMNKWDRHYVKLHGTPLRKVFNIHDDQGNCTIQYFF